MEKTLEKNTRPELQSPFDYTVELTELELAIVGGGIGDPIAA